MPKKILIADDNEDLRSLLAYQLQLRGYQIVTAADGVQAVDKCRAEKPDLVLLDVIMPGMDGAEAGAALHEDPALQNIPVIFLTALVHGTEGKAHEEGSNRYTLPKSISVDELATKIEEILTKPSEGLI